MTFTICCLTFAAVGTTVGPSGTAATSGIEARSIHIAGPTSAQPTLQTLSDEEKRELWEALTQFMTETEEEIPPWGFEEAWAKKS